MTHWLHPVIVALQHLIMAMRIHMDLERSFPEEKPAIYDLHVELVLFRQLSHASTQASHISTVLQHWGGSMTAGADRMCGRAARRCGRTSWNASAHGDEHSEAALRHDPYAGDAGDHWPFTKILARYEGI
jgi:hypothetical protein